MAAPLHALVALALVLSTPAVAQSTWHVDASATPPGNGSAAQPFTDLQNALAQLATVSGDTILVEPGIYIGPFDYLGKDVTVRSAQGADVTILDGNQQQVSVVDFIRGEGPGAVLDGFTVRGGRGSPSVFPPLTQFPNREGGGIRCANSSPTLTNLIVTGNRAWRGAGVVLLNSATVLSHSEIRNNSGELSRCMGVGVFSNLPTVRIENCVFRQNGATAQNNVHGGGFCGRAVVRDCVFRNHFGMAGAGAYVFGATFERCTFENNIGSADAAESVTWGGAISHLEGQWSFAGYPQGPTLVVDCAFFGNRASRGGAIASHATGLVTVQRSVFAGNAARKILMDGQFFGGATMNCDLFDCELSGNSSDLQGGAIWGGSAARCRIHDNVVSGFGFSSESFGGAGACDADLVDCEVFNNTAFHQFPSTTYSILGGGALRGSARNTLFVANSAGYGGGVAGGVVTNCTLIGNTANIAGGSMWAASGSAGVGTLTAKNTIARGGVPNEIAIQGTPVVSVTYSDIQGDHPGVGNFDSDPRFFAPQSGDFHLKPGSPCIDAGDPSSPLDPNGTSADVGAFPFDATHCSAPGVWCAGKPNSLGCVPEMGFSGTPSVTGPDNFFVTGSSFLGQAFGLMAWSRSASAIPFQGGTLCLAAPFFRAGLQFAGGTAGACDGTYSFHFSQGYRAAFGVLPYETIHAQWFARDAANPDGTGWSLSNALEFTVCP